MLTKRAKAYSSCSSVV